MNFPQNLKYTNEHEWIRVEGDIAYVGITDYAQEQLGDIVFVDIPTVGETLEAGETFGTIEVVKTISDRSRHVLTRWKGPDILQQPISSYRRTAGQNIILPHKMKYGRHS